MLYCFHSPVSTQTFQRSQCGTKIFREQLIFHTDTSDRHITCTDCNSEHYLAIKIRECICTTSLCGTLFLGYPDLHDSQGHPYYCFGYTTCSKTIPVHIRNYGFGPCIFKTINYRYMCFTHLSKLTGRAFSTLSRMSVTSTSPA